MSHKIRACGRIAAGFSVVFACAISGAHAQPPLVYVEDCGKTAVPVCADTGQLMGWASRPYHYGHYGYYGKRAHHIYLNPSYDLPTREREWLWYDP
jgi:hypothetical protein